MMRSLATLAVEFVFLRRPSRLKPSRRRRKLAAPVMAKKGQQKDHPVIWGQQLSYLFIELRDFKVSARKNDLMSPIAQGLDPSDLMPLAQYFSQKPWPNLPQPPATGDVAAQAQRINAAIICTSCHQEGFKGDSAQPRLAGQNHDYLAKTMTDFRTGARANNPGMTDLMKAMSESDVAALATYIAGLQL
jgi:cytochrome c553